MYPRSKERGITAPQHPLFSIISFHIRPCDNLISVRASSILPEELSLEGKGINHLAVALDHALRGTSYRVREAGTVYTPVGILRNALFVEGEGRIEVVVWSQASGAKETAEKLLPTALKGTFLEGATVRVYGNPPPGVPKLSVLMDTRSLGLSPTLPARPGEYAMWWKTGDEEVFSTTKEAEAIGAYVQTVAGKEREALLVWANLLGMPVSEVGNLPGEALIPLLTETGRPVVLSWRPDRGPRLHFLRSHPREEALAILMNATRLLKRELLSVPKRSEAPMLLWWKNTLRVAGEYVLDAVGRVVVKGSPSGKDVPGKRMGIL